MKRTKLTIELIKSIADLVQVGNYAQVAAKSVGVPERTFYLWLSKGRAGKKPYVQLVQAIEDAESKAEIALVLTIRKSLPDNPGFAFEMLRRRFRDRWNPNQPPSINVQSTSQVVVSGHSVIEPDRALELVRAQLKADETNQRN